MLKKIYRVNKNWEYQNIYRKGRHLSSQFFGINFLPNKFDFPRFGVVVSKKIAKKAVDRNLLKRQVREIVTELAKKHRANYDVIITVRSKALGTSYAVLKKELEESFKKINLI